MQFSVQKFDSVKEVKYPWGWIRWMMNSELDPATSQTFGIVQIDAGKRNQLHKHPNCEELLYVLSGSFESVVGSRRVVLHAGDIIRIPANVPHQGINNTNAPMRAVISYSSGVRQIVTLEFYDRMRGGAEENFVLCRAVPARLESRNCVLRHEAFPSSGIRGQQHKPPYDGPSSLPARRTICGHLTCFRCTSR